ncbi:hypothetical protein PRZ48_014822 [Zasmidium cellare]|uniref:Uncharacterized protein n=1 Tax=Zasmidium cellare TaxID=395010 RepID=A0ABR0DZE2_ZASCE|nr:hypothetical protein PRZ48_014822 [Zasmidium cellare]
MSFNPPSDSLKRASPAKQTGEKRHKRAPRQIPPPPSENKEGSEHASSVLSAWEHYPSYGQDFDPNPKKAKLETLRQLKEKIEAQKQSASAIAQENEELERECERWEGLGRMKDMEEELREKDARIATLETENKQFRQRLDAINRGYVMMKQEDWEELLEMVESTVNSRDRLDNEAYAYHETLKQVSVELKARNITVPEEIGRQLEELWRQ